MSRSAVKVVLRTRPTDSFAQDQLQINQGRKVLFLQLLPAGAGCMRVLRVSTDSCDSHRRL